MSATGGLGSYAWQAVAGLLAVADSLPREGPRAIAFVDETIDLLVQSLVDQDDAEGGAEPDDPGLATHLHHILSAVYARRTDGDPTMNAERALDHVTAATTAVRQLLTNRTLPAARNDSRCRKCSLRDDCLPEITDGRHRTATGDLFTPRPLGHWRD